MSVQSEIDRINGEVNSQSTIIDQISSVLDSKSPSNMLSSGAIVTNSVSTPLQNNTTKLQALKEKADSLPEYVPPTKLQEKTVTPTKEGLSVVPDSGFDGMSKVTVNGDSNLVPENIKEGVSIFGITGTNVGVEWKSVLQSKAPDMTETRYLNLTTDTLPILVLFKEIINGVWDDAIIFGVWLAQSMTNTKAFSATSYDHVVLSATTVKESNGKFDVTLGYQNQNGTTYYAIIPYE